MSASRRRLLAGAAVLPATWLLGGCASLLRERPPGRQWNGRLAMRVLGQAPQSFSAAFSLLGSPDRGELTLFTPIGSTAAVLSWSPGTALLRAEGQPPQHDTSVDALVERATGAPLPVAALFDWLDGRATAVAGWLADISQLAQGRLTASRLDPPPTMELRVVLEQP
ncbi:MAG: outer membrane lipoprotein LolB [Pseudomonadota bacterium]